jgi:hypothetical protein
MGFVSKNIYIINLYLQNLFFCVDKGWKAGSPGNQGEICIWVRGFFGSHLHNTAGWVYNAYKHWLFSFISLAFSKSTRKNLL